MQILLIDRHITLGEDSYIDDHAHIVRQWAKQGHKVTVLTATYSPMRNVNRQKGGKEVLDGVTFKYIKVPKYDFKNYKKYVFASRVFYHKLRWINKYSVLSSKLYAIIVSSAAPLDYNVVKKYAKRKKIDVFYDLDQLWPTEGIECYGFSGVKKYMKKLNAGETDIFYGCKHIISKLEFADSHLRYKQFTADGYYHFLPKGIDASSHDNTLDVNEKTKAELGSIKDGGYAVLGVYSGDIDESSIKTAIDAVLKIKEKIITVIATPNDKDFEIYKKHVQDASAVNSNIKVIRINEDEQDSFYRECDIIYFGVEPNPLHRYGVIHRPLLRCMLAAKPIITAISASNDLMDDCRCGINIKPGDSELLAKMADEMAMLTEDEREMVGMRGRLAVENELDFPIIAERYIEIMQKPAVQTISRDEEEVEEHVISH